MYVEISAPSKRFITLVTLVRFITSSVNVLVFVKCTVVPKCFAVCITDVWFITCVNAFVYDEVALLCKGFITHAVFILVPPASGGKLSKLGETPSPPLSSPPFPPLRDA